MSRFFKNKNTIAILIIVGIMVSQVYALHTLFVKTDIESKSAATAISEPSNDTLALFESHLALTDYNILHTPLPFTLALLGLGMLGVHKKKT